MNAYDITERFNIIHNIDNKALVMRDRDGRVVTLSCEGGGDWTVSIAADGGGWDTTVENTTDGVARVLRLESPKEDDERFARFVNCDCNLGCNVCDPPPADWGEQANCIKNGPMCRAV
jgi:hypothetical protein